jgi:phenylalanyl-tRNA synthetase beta chain
VALRHSLLASALEIVADNSRFRERVCLFEISKVYLAAEEGELPDEIGRISLVMVGSRQPAQWQANGTPGHYDFFDLKGVIEGLLAQLHIEDWRVEAVSHPTYRPGHTARIWLGDKALGTMGELHPLVVEAFEIRTRRRSLPPNWTWPRCWPPFRSGIG